MAILDIMEIINPWEALRSGNAEQGLKLFREAYVQKPYGSETMQLGTALLWLRHYGPAWEHFQDAINARAPKGASNKKSVFYGMAGVAKWCLGNQREAVSEWLSGLKAKYADAAGLGVKIPLLLFFASIIRPDLYDDGTARKLMLEKIKDKRIESWPGPILQWILGQISEDEFLNHCRGRHERDLQDSLWQAEFYRSLMRFEPDRLSVFKESMSKLSDIERPELQDQSMFLRRIWTEEFFLARHEATADLPSQSAL